jgi:hypothetical protein
LHLLARLDRLSELHVQKSSTPAVSPTVGGDQLQQWFLWSAGFHRTMHTDTSVPYTKWSRGTHQVRSCVGTQGCTVRCTLVMCPMTDSCLPYCGGRSAPAMVPLVGGAPSHMHADTSVPYTKWNRGTHQVRSCVGTQGCTVRCTLVMCPRTWTAFPST